MATLESLELTIESNAQSAVQGIGSLIRSLSALPAIGNILETHPEVALK